MTPSRSEFHRFHGIDYHCRIWEPAAGTAATASGSAPITLFCLHGYMDVSASFQFMVDALMARHPEAWRIIAPDWRGFGQTGWTPAETYWFPDYLADLEAILGHYSPDAPVNLLGHSLGGNVASLYAGARPARVARLINLEGFGMDRIDAAAAPGRYARWLGELAVGERLRDYDSFEALAARLRAGNPRLTEARALFLARHWGALKDERVVLRADPRHKIVNPILYRLEEARACWQQVTAPVLWVTGDQTKSMRFDETEHAARKACFRNLTAQVIADAGHMLHHDQPEALARAIEDFIPAAA